MKKKFFALRWTLSAVSFIGFFLLMGKAFEISSFSSAAYMIYGFSALIISILFTVPETVIPLCEFFSRIFTSIIFPDDKFRKPMLTYILARRYAKEARYVEAIYEYRKIIHYYPDELEAYEELISISGISGQVSLAEKYQKKLNRRIAKAEYIT